MITRNYFRALEVLKGDSNTMKRKGITKCTSVLIALCMVLACIGVTFTSVGAATTVSGAQVSSANQNDNFTWDNASVYFLLTDRFRNGNTSNDHSYGRATDANGNPIPGWDTAPGTFHGGDFAGVTRTIEEGYFDDLGINAIWISAPYEQTHGYCDSGKGFAHYSYHGYYVLDYTNTDANFGTAEEFETLVDTAHEHGIRVIMDIVMNHAGYNTVADMEQYNFGTLLDGASEFKYKLDGVSDVNKHIDFKSSAADWGRWWSNDWIRSGLPGYSEDGDGSDYTKSLSGLPDFRTEQTKSVSIPPILQTKWKQEGTYNEKIAKYGSSNTVTGYISSWLADWVRTYGVDGFRCDTAKHVEKSSWKQLKTACVSALKEWRQNNPSKPGAGWDEDFWMTGEAWDHGVGYDSYYSEGGFDSMINFDTCGGGSLSTDKLAGKYQGYADAINSRDDFNALSFVSSHDEVLANQSQNMYYIGSAFQLLPGAVQLFYGDESNRGMFPGLSFDGYGGSGHSLRSDMNWDSLDTDLLAHWQKVGTFRNNHVSIGAGSNIKLSATSGVAFGRTYSKNGISDRAAGVVGASANSTVTIDVSALWLDGQPLMNAYDQSSATVSGGKVTFNSGAHGTILIQEPDGRPLLTVTGNAKFMGTQTVTVHLQECETAKCSVDGGNKFYVKDGDTFTIGGTAYDGDTVKVTLEGENEKGKSSSTVSFIKVASSGDLTEPTTTQPEGKKGELHVKTWDGSAPNVYVWIGDSTALCGGWPGTQMTQKDADGNYVIYLDTTEKFNVVMNNGSGTQSGDIKNLYGVTYLEVTGSDYNTKIISTESKQGGSSELTEESVTIRVKSYDGSAPNLYVWTDEEKLTGSWPGQAMSEKDADGNYVMVFEHTASCNAIVNNGSGQTADITGISGDVLIEIKDAGCTSYKLTKKEIPLSGMALLKKEAREVKTMTSSDYTAQSWASVSSLMPSVDALIAQGSEADETAVESAAAQLKSAKAGLVLATPRITYAVSGNALISGISVPDADVTVTVNGQSYKAKSDDVTGAFTVSAAVLSSSSSIKVTAARNGKSSGTYSYNMANGNIQTGEAPTSPSVPSTQPTIQESTAIGGRQLGDVNGDGEIDIKDATAIQKHIARLEAISPEYLSMADVNHDNNLTVTDATLIQKYIARLIKSF